MNYEDVIINETSRRDIYKCLSKCHQPPEDNLIEITRELERLFSIISSKASSNATRMCSCLGERLPLEALQKDYARLFVGPYALLAPPYGSLYLDGQHRIMGATTMDAMQYYKDAGLEVASTFKEAPDHIATELEFMYALIHDELRTLGGGDNHLFNDTLRLQQGFFTNHLGRWIEPFAHAVRSNAKTDFYINLADVMEIFLSEDANYLVDLQIDPALQARKSSA